jgi:hypothetical protein
MVEFKKRYGLEGLSNGLDVTHNWRPTMTTAWGFPILMDPRLCAIPTRMGLISPQLEDYKAQLHDLHYDWYLKARQHDIVMVRQAYDEELARQVPKLPSAALAGSMSGNPANTDAQMVEQTDLGFEDDSDDEAVVVDIPAPVDIGPPEVPLITKDVFRVRSAEMYRLYKTACKQLPWRTLYTDPKYCIEKPGVVWQELIYDVELQPVWQAIDELNSKNQFGFFPIMALKQGICLQTPSIIVL